MTTKNENTLPKREYAFVVTAKYGLTATKSHLLIKTIQTLGCKYTVESNGKTAEGSSIMEVLVLGMECGTQGKIIFSKPIHPADLWKLPDIHDVVEFDLPRAL